MELTIKEIQAIETEMLKELADICDRNNLEYYLAYGSVIGAIRHKGPIPWDTDADIIVPYNQLEIFISLARKELSGKFFVDYHDTNKSYCWTFPRIGLKGYSTNILHIDIFTITGISEIKLCQKRLINKGKILRRMFYYKMANEDFIGEISTRHKFKIMIYRIFLLPISKNLIKEKIVNLNNKTPYDTAKYVVNYSGTYGLKEIIKKSVFGTGFYAEYSNLAVKVPELYGSYLSHFYNDYMELPSEAERKIKNSYGIIKL